MNRALPAIILVLAAILAIILKAPPKVRENMQTYYKTLIQAPAAQMTQFTARAVKPKPVQKPAPTPPSKPVTHSDGPQISVLGGVMWDRKTRPAESLASHSESHAEKTEHSVAADPVVEPTQHIEQAELKPALATE